MHFETDDYPVLCVINNRPPLPPDEKLGFCVILIMQTEKSVLPNMVTKAADEVILACISQFSLRNVVKTCGDIESVENVIGSRLKKSNAVTSTTLSTVPVLYPNIDSTAYPI